MRLRKVLARRALLLDQIGNSIQLHAVHSETKPEIEDAQDRLADERILKIEVRLMEIKAVPVVSLRYRIPRPV